MFTLSVLFDLDGVVSDTASVHAKAWKVVFDRFLEGRGEAGRPFQVESDYLLHLDGKMRTAGIESFIQSRGLAMPPSGPADDNGLETINGIGNIKNRIFRELISDGGVTIFGDATRLMGRLMDAGCPLGLASSSKNAAFILDKAGLTPLFEAVLDGNIAEERQVASKPHPDFYRYVAALLGRPPGECAVIEDAISGIISARRAGIGLVVGISRHGDSRALWDSGADMVVETLDDVPTEKFIGFHEVPHARLYR